MRCGVNDNERVDFRASARANADEQFSLEDELAAAVREADLALAEAGYLSRLQRNRKSALDFSQRPAIKARALPNLL